MEESIAELWQEDIISTFYSPLSGMANPDLGESQQQCRSIRSSADCCRLFVDGVSVLIMSDSKSEIRDNMQIEWDVAIAMDDGIVLRADVFRPVGQAKHPVILSYGPYAKGLSFQEGYKGNWARLVEAAPEVSARPTNIRTGNWSTLRDGFRMAMPAYALTRVVPDARPACSTCGPRGRR